MTSGEGKLRVKALAGSGWKAGVEWQALATLGRAPGAVTGAQPGHSFPHNLGQSLQFSGPQALL